MIYISTNVIVAKIMKNIKDIWLYTKTVWWIIKKVI